MTELTDLEVCKRIAEIEGYEVFIHPDTRAIYIDNGSYEEMFLYNPLEDKALCWDLMIKYELDFIKSEDNSYYVGWSLRVNEYIGNICPQRAICLAIIEKHNDN